MLRIWYFIPVVIGNLFVKQRRDWFSCCLVAKLCPVVCIPMDCSMPGFPVLHLLDRAQTHVHWVGDAIQWSHPLFPPSPFVFNLSQYQGLLQWVTSFHQVAKILELQLQYQPSPAPQYESISSSVLSLLYGPILTSVHEQWKNHRFGIFRSLLAKWCLWLWYAKSVMTLLPRSRPLLISRLQSPCSDFGTQGEKNWHSFLDTFPPICLEVMGLDAMILTFWMLSFKPAFPLPSFTLIKRFFQFNSVAQSCLTLCDPMNCSTLGLPVGEGNGTPLQYSCLENPMGRGAW